MSARELRSLACARLNIDGADSVVEKPELIRTIVESGKIEVISAPEPVEYGAVAELRAMGVGKLRRAMEEAGVFFDPIDVVEKEDMVQIFVKSGRVVFREEEEAEENADPGYGYGGLKQMSITEKVENGATDGASFQRYRSMEAVDGGNECAGQADGCLETETMEVDAPSQISDQASTMENGVDERISQGEPHPLGHEENEVRVRPRSDEGNEDHTDAPPSAEFVSAESATSSYPTPPEPSAMPPAFASRTVSELKALGRELGVDLSTCIEKREMVEKLAARVSARR